MCNRLNQSSSETETLVLFDQNQNQVVTDNNNMDSPPPVTSPDEAPRVKFLCSFGGSILPRPQDGKLRYVGGETRIVSLPREINYEELMLRMKELFEGATSLKYQQPDEDLDALVSVVNDDDVTNMMEEYDKLGSGDGFTRLRMFLFSHPDYDSSSMVGHFETDDRETERRYVDALNSLNESPRKQPSPESPVTIPVGSEQFFNPVTPEFGIHNQRNSDALLPQFNLRELRIPHLGSGQHQIETSMSPAYYSPRHHGHHDPRTMTEYPTSPGSGRYRMGFGELPPDHSLNHQLPPSPYEHQPPFPENVVWLPPGAIPVDNGGFPGNLSNTSSVIEGGNSICDNCRMTFQRCPNMPDSARYPDSRWRQQHLEPQPNIGNEFHQLGDPCVQCTHGREAYMVNQDGRLDYGMGNDHLYIDAHSHDRGWVMHHQLSNRREEARGHISGAGRVNEQYVVDGPGLSFHHLHGNCVDGHQASSNCVSHEDPRYVRSGSEFGNEGFHDQAMGVPPQIHVPISEDRGVRYGNMPAAYGADNLYQVSHGPASTPVPTPAPAPTPTPSLWIKVHNPLHNVPSYEALNMLPQATGSVTSGFVRGVHESSPRFHNGLDNQNPWVGPQQKMFGYEGTSTPEFQHGYAPKLNLRAPNQENQNSFPANPVCSPQELSMLVEPVPHTYSPRAAINDANHSSSSSRYIPAPTNGTGPPGPMVLEEKRCLEEASGMTVEEKVEDFNSVNISSPDIKETNSNSNGLLTNAVGIGNLGVGETGLRDISDHEKLTVKYSGFIPELVASVKKVALEGGEEVKAGVQGEAEGEVTTPDMEDDSDNDHKNISKIEPTKAEEEALAEGLQTIRNDDLEEIRELGSGTYGSVYYGKWKGSDVAIKRIKASCFAGRPSERERLIADFWKEASKLSGLRHPNVVSFYGIVRDSPDGCLATVTEFMVNGSLKQFIRKKDRTIDRRKRLIIAMDAAFGMEYLHEKNIVHFDLKCENLLVNMRDPHRPVCKIGDLGLSKVKQHTLVSGGVRGTLPWMAPELLSGTSNMVSEKIDVYSFGIVMWELLTGEEPYADMHGASLIGGVVHNSLRPEVPSWCDPEWKSLMESCWSSEPGERPSFSEISQRLRKMSATSK